MSSYKQIIYHLIFGTKRREFTIPESHCLELYKYIWGITKNKKCTLYRINGIGDHIHILTDLHPSQSLADFIKDIKIASSNWMKENPDFPNWDGWALGYGAFTYSNKEKPNLVEYIKNQKEHHKKESFYDEYKRLLIENEIEFKEEYLFK
ncbi:IS200/IS605 family transposase [Aquiflexum sp. TKW24L]|uniref:IS200/IS605 family transposase n=1 Tax=Cyclobacteriaceae TaxID=563798 RepID=UPI001F13FBD7|nr:MULTISPECIES: IS200/IS605 family transposase [Cyclobacteriaceae]MCH6232467.1 IS200/IS605 family transposase [Cognataquiflexum rubidum]MCL6257954.1 IS200/IS605 family transposase [Aquiflexum sp. TKW24L]